MKKFAILFAALCMVAFVTSESSAQCSRGGGFYGGGGGVYRGGGFGGYRGSVYRPTYSRSIYRGSSRSFGRSFGGYGGGFNRGFGGYGGRGISIRY